MLTIVSTPNPRSDEADILHTRSITVDPVTDAMSLIYDTGTCMGVDWHFVRRENQQIEQTDRGFHLTLSGYPRSMPSKMSCIFSPVLARLTFFALSLHLRTFLRCFVTTNCRNYFLAFPAGNSDGCDWCVGLLLFLIPILDDCDMPSCPIPFSVLCFALLQPAARNPLVVARLSCMKPFHIPTSPSN